jgi:hypothetical protein
MVKSWQVKKGYSCHQTGIDSQFLENRDHHPKNEPFREERHLMKPLLSRGFEIVKFYVRL